MAKLERPKSRLGRGLSSLISVSELPVTEEVAPPAGLARMAPAEASGEALQVPVDQISPNPHQPRRTMNEASIAELAASLKSNGLIQPIVVRKTADGYQLIAGERRWRAAKLAGLTKIPVVVKDVDAFTQAQMALVENIQREDLNPIERAQGYRTLMDQLGLTQAELAGRLGEERSSIANFVRLLDLAEPVRAKVRDGQLSLGHAKLLAGVADILEQQRLADLVVAQGLSVRNLERLLTSPATPPPPKVGAAPSPAYQQELEKSISRQLGLRVQVKQGAKKGKGKIVLHYANLDQFDELMQRMGVKVD
jgi:ParB family transcriptional regulator, chromosome partitioning protein